MPKRKRTSRRAPSRKRRRRRFLRAKRRYARKIRIGGFPKSKAVKLRYVDRVSIDAATAIPAVHYFWANGMYDPDYTGVGHQPSNFDRWMEIYDHYTVLGSRITVVPVLGDTVAQAACIYGVMLTDSFTGLTGINNNNLLEQPGSRYSKFPFGQDTSKNSKITHRFSARKFFGKNNKSMIGDGSYRGDASNNPSENAMFAVWAQDTCGNNPPSLCFYVYIDFYAILTEPKKADAS